MKWKAWHSEIMTIEASWESQHITNQNEEIGNRHLLVRSTLSMHVFVVSFFVSRCAHCSSEIGVRHWTSRNVTASRVDCGQLTHPFSFFQIQIAGTQLMRLNRTACPSGLRGWAQVPLAQAVWVQITKLSVIAGSIITDVFFDSIKWDFFSSDQAQAVATVEEEEKTCWSEGH